MDEVIKKVSSYDLLNSLIPGAALVYFMKVFGYLDYVVEDAFYLVVFAYALGLVASRIGSLILEPIAIKRGLFQHDYVSFMQAETDDDRLTNLVTISNMYRTLAGALIMLAVLALGSLVPMDSRLWLYIGYGVACFLLLFCGWVKQERYVARRVELRRKDADDNR